MKKPRRPSRFDVQMVLILVLFILAGAFFYGIPLVLAIKDLLERL